MRIVTKQELIDHLHATVPKHDAVIRSEDGKVFAKQHVWACTDVTNAIGNFESTCGRLIEIDVPANGGLAPLIEALELNGYSVQTSVIWKEYPKNEIDHFVVRIESRKTQPL